ncbi:hypothetical protein B0I18_10284 [Taibaiella chishuiensis]|uniref:Uncharacterized protein n=1 Tax=Taibaiella chishuiensis TaxID=1434707 RepID=A0A2P8D7A1_9BACT|nr:hypothetical protein B0I18_10284 [Taibaiella chishuiensis]
MNSTTTSESIVGNRLAAIYFKYETMYYTWNSFPLWSISQ